MAELKPRKQPAGAPGSKFVDPVESASGKITEHLNYAHGATLLLLAWHFAERRDTVLGQMVQVDRLGFELRCHFHGATYVEKRVNFKCGPIDDGPQIVDYIRNDMRVEAGCAPWPAGPWPALVLAAYAAVAVVYAESHGGGALALLPNRWAEHLPDRHDLHWAFMVVAGTHAVMASACCWILAGRLQAVAPRHLPRWFAACFVLGYPTWCQVLALKRANTQGRLKRL